MSLFERNKKSKELTDTFVSLYDPNLGEGNYLRTTRGLINTFLQLIQDISDTLEFNLELIYPKQTTTYGAYKDDFNFLKAFYKTLRKTNIKLAFTPSKVPPKGYDNTFVWYYSDEDIEKEDPMIVENADDFICHTSDDFDLSKAKAPPITHAVINLEDEYDRINVGLPPLDKNKNSDSSSTSSDPYYPIKISLYEALEQTLRGSISWCKAANYPMDKALELLISELQSKLKTLRI